MYRLNYIFPDGQFVSLDRIRDFSDHFHSSWLHNMVESNPDVIFFFTVDSTDIW